jgi:hypothetical protein
MPRWTDDLADLDVPRNARLHRCRPGKTVAGIITSQRMLKCPVHYWKGRTTPCEEKDCEACTANRLARWYGWVGLWGPNNHEHVIAELTQACFEPLYTYALDHGTLRGAKLALARTSQKLNSRLAARIEASTYSLDVLPDEIDIRATLEHIWETHDAKQLSPRLADTSHQPDRKHA